MLSGFCESKREGFKEGTCPLQKDALERALTEKLQKWQPSEAGRASLDDVSPAVSSSLSFLCHGLDL